MKVRYSIGTLLLLLQCWNLATVKRHSTQYQGHQGQTYQAPDGAAFPPQMPVPGSSLCYKQITELMYSTDGKESCYTNVSR